ncbi:unnamed protein product [Amoebophrya sp. A120]|nr:unnamed protein product [Amoebophrya sp. A120]|eukprot:GSA120T00019592001.1
MSLLVLVQELHKRRVQDLWRSSTTKGTSCSAAVLAGALLCGFLCEQGEHDALLGRFSNFRGVAAVEVLVKTRTKNTHTARQHLSSVDFLGDCLPRLENDLAECKRCCSGAHVYKCTGRCPNKEANKAKKAQQKKNCNSACETEFEEYQKTLTTPAPAPSGGDNTGTSTTPTPTPSGSDGTSGSTTPTPTPSASSGDQNSGDGSSADGGGEASAAGAATGRSGAPQAGGSVDFTSQGGAGSNTNSAAKNSPPPSTGSCGSNTTVIVVVVVVALVLLVGIGLILFRLSDGGDYYSPDDYYAPEDAFNYSQGKGTRGSMIMGTKGGNMTRPSKGGYGNKGDKTYGGGYGGGGYY